jgi:hypothetical protein
VRSIVRADSVKECEKRVKIKEREGWKPVNNMKPKLDDSHLSWGEVSYVVVMEKPDNEEYKAKNQNRRFNRFYRQD